LKPRAIIAFGLNGVSNGRDGRERAARHHQSPQSYVEHAEARKSEGSYASTEARVSRQGGNEDTSGTIARTKARSSMAIGRPREDTYSKKLTVRKNTAGDSGA